MKMKWLVAVVLLLAVSTGLIYRYVRGLMGDDTDIVRVWGNIEVTDVELSPRIGGWVRTRPASEGQAVNAGELVAELDTKELAHEVARRKAEVRAARANLAELEAGTRPEEIGQAEAAVQKARAWLDELLTGSRPQEIAAAEATVQAARVDSAHLLVEYERHHGLRRTGAASAMEYDTAKAKYGVSLAKVHEAEERLKLVKDGPRKEQIEQARASVKDAQERLALARNGPREETIEQARARLEHAKEAQAVAETRLGYATLVSPISGLILSENVEAGEYVAPGTPIVTVGDMERPWLRAYINETDLGRVKVGQRVRLTTDTYPNKIYEGVVSFIASEAEFTPKSVQTEKERVKLVYRVKIDLSNPNFELKPGMPAGAEIVLK